MSNLLREAGTVGNVIVKSETELREWREQLLREAGMPYDELDDRAKEFAVTEDQLNIWETIRSIDFLLGNGRRAA